MHTLAWLIHKILYSYTLTHVLSTYCVHIFAQHNSKTAHLYRLGLEAPVAPLASTCHLTGHFDRARLQISHQTLPQYPNHTTILRYPTTPPNTGMIRWGLITCQRITLIFCPTSFYQNQTWQYPPLLVGAFPSILLPSPTQMGTNEALKQCALVFFSLSWGPLSCTLVVVGKTFWKIAWAPFDGNHGDRWSRTDGGQTYFGAL